ncbi:MAG: hypothetical protein K2W82_16595 [Candidatus Obscuribacterales bacterium]|nr:hypothetical protein [Candidatus Obscuribacterales bacterium]
MSVKQVDFVRALLGSDVAIYSKWCTGEVELNLDSLFTCSEGFRLIVQAQSFSSCHPSGALAMMNQAREMGRTAGDKLLEVVALSEMACCHVSVGKALEYLGEAREILLADIEAAGLALVDQYEPDIQIEIPEPDSFVAARFKGAVRVCKEMLEAADLARIAARRADSDAILQPRQQLLELIESNFEQFELLKVSDFFRGRRGSIEHMIKHKDWAGAEQIARMTFEHAEQVFGINHWWYAVFATLYGHVLVKTGRIDTATYVLPYAREVFLEWVVDPASSPFREYWLMFESSYKEMDDVFSPGPPEDLE